MLQICKKMGKIFKKSKYVNKYEKSKIKEWKNKND